MNFQQLRSVRETVRQGFNLTGEDFASMGRSTLTPAATHFQTL